MNLFQAFILNILETGSFIILWSVFNKKRDNLIIKNLTLILVCSLIISETDNLNIKFSSIINYVIIIFSIYIFYHKKIYDIILEFDIAVIILIIIELLLTIPVWITSKPDTLYSFKNGLLVDVVLLIICIGMYFLLPVNKFYKKYLLSNFKIRILVFNLTIWIICFKLFWDYNIISFINSIVIFMIISLLFILVSYILYVQNIELNKQRKMVELNREYYPMFDTILHEVRRKQHEFKNHLNAIYGICYLTDTDILKHELEKYIKFLNYTLKDIDDIININNKVFAAVIYSKLCEAKNKQIKFLYTINTDINNFKISEYEIVEVLSNLLNNAFEASSYLNVNEKIVYLKVGKEQSHYFIEVGNNGVTLDINNINKIFKKGFSTKSKSFRGYGLYNVKNIIESYGGHIQVSLENGYTLFKLLF